MPFATADGRMIDTAYANAGGADADMQGMRVSITLRDAKPCAAIMDGDGAGRWSSTLIDQAMSRIVEMVIADTIDIYDQDGVDAWLI